MSRNPQIDRLISIIEPVCADVGLELVDLRLLMEQGGWVLRVCIDRPLPEGVDLSEVNEERVDLEMCEQVSRLLSAALDVDDPIPQAYNLEVSSPGIDRPLRTAAHFARYAGAEAKIQLAVPLVVAGPGGVSSERRNFRGVLGGVVSAAAGALVVIDVDGARFELPLDDIDSAKLVPDWDDVMRGGSGVSRPKQAGKAAKPSRPSKSDKPGKSGKPGQGAQPRAAARSHSNPSDPSSDESSGEARGASSDPSPDVP
jgi:ribosome maturation factor RimP